MKYFMPAAMFVASAWLDINGKGLEAAAMFVAALIAALVIHDE